MQKDELKNFNNRISIFEKIKKINEFGQEYWSARDLSSILEYQKWDKFQNVIKKAIESCKNSKQPVENHILQTGKMVKSLRNIHPLPQPAEDTGLFCVYS